MRKSLLLVAIAALPAYGQELTDTTDLQEVVVLNAKENHPIREQALSGTSITSHTLKERGIYGIKDISTLAPGLFIPSYGSHQTTSIYMRGIGSRINTPAVGMYVDDVPWVNKSAFDVNIEDIERIEVLRGPQSTLYGRNAMGGLIRIATKNPLQYQGTDITLSGAMYNNYRVSATHYHRISDKLGFSGGVGYVHKGGFFENDYTGDKVDDEDDFRIRFRMVAKPSEIVKLDFQANYELTRQGAFPYTLVSVPDDDMFKDDISSSLGRISYNRDNSYRRHLLNLGLTAEHRWQHFYLSNILGFQFLKDDMKMDQDFTGMDIYTLNQKQNSKVLSEEIALKSRAEEKIQWTAGANFSYQWLNTDGPVTFWSDGMTFLNRTINGYMPDLSTMGMKMNVNMTDKSMAMNGNYDTPMLNTALFGQISVPIVAGFSATAGIRVDYEKNSLDYNSYGEAHYDFTMMRGAIPVMNLTDQTVTPSFLGSLSSNSWKVLPKVALQYDFGHQRNAYISVSRGARSGGYNVQMFSELLQTQIKNQMMHDLRHTDMPELDVSEACLYKPEYAWNYEVGTHLDFLNGRLKADAAAFFMRITNQQISQMASSGLGRVTTNAGRSRSVGAELSLQALITDALSAHLSYGYTHATFRDYKAAEGVSYRGKYVPFMPQHTFDAGARYTWNLKGFVEHITLGANWHGAGRIYWTEDNEHSQSFYGTLDSRVTLTHQKMDFSVWGNNLTNRKYDAFYFQSMSRGFAQQGAPLQVGVDLRIRM